MQSSFQSNLVSVKCYLPSPWIPSLHLLHFSGFVLLPISQSGWELWADTSAFLLISTRVSSVRSAVFPRSRCFYSDTSAERDLIKPFSPISFSFSPFLPVSPFSPPPRRNRMEQIRESIQCNHDKWVPVVSKDFFVRVCVCLGRGCWEITNESISCYRISKHRRREGGKDRWMNDGRMDGWMDGWRGVGEEDSVYQMCVCVCAYARLLCRDRWLIEYRAMWVSVCVNESRRGGAV